MYDLKRQGDADMITAFALEARQKLRVDDKVVKLIWGWWCTAMQVGHLDSEPEPEFISKEQYITLSVSLNRMLSEVPVNEGQALEHAQEDWQKDKVDGKEEMDYEHFFNSVRN